MSDQPTQVLEYVADIVAAYVGNNALNASELPDLMQAVHSTLVGIDRPKTEARKPAVDPRRSLHPTHIVCLEEGKRFESLKRHLGTAHGLTPEEYRRKWNLPPDYPMVAAEYALTRSQLAMESGLGRKAR